jgi:6-phosphogluconolactonase (cycloisomerase 2 family)
VTAFQRQTRRFAGRTLMAAALASALASDAAMADLGDLTPLGCIEDTGDSECASSTAGLDGGVSVAVSADAENAYVAAFNDDAVHVFTRNPDGTLTSTACFQNTGGSDCDGSGGDTVALDGAADVAVSPDGESVYVVSNESNAIALFTRAIDGSLTFQGCIQDSSSGELCEGIGGESPGLRSANGVAISPDGQNVYVASFLSDSVTWFTRAEDGTLTPQGCIQNTGGTACAGIGGTTAGLDGAYDVTVSPDGLNVYVVSYVSDAVVTFDRAPDGTLTSDSCVQNPGLMICATSFAGLDGPRSVAVSPDGDNVYVGALIDDSLVTFDRAAGGALTPVSCFQGPSFVDCNGSGGTTIGLDGVSATIVSPDGKQVYVASLTSDALTAFDRAPDGSLSTAGCIQNTGRTECANAGGSTTAGLDGAIDVATSPAGDSLYVVSFNSDAVVAFVRDLSTTTTTTNTTTTTTSTTTTSTTNTTTTSTTLSTTTTTLEPTTTTTSTTLEPTTTTTVEPTTTTVPDTTTTTVPETTTTTVLQTTTTMVPETTTTTVPEVTTTTVPQTTTTMVADTTTTTVPETTTTTAPETTTTTGEPPTTTTSTTLEPPVCGDVNDSGEVTAIDALAILKAAVGGDQCDALPCVCDVAGGGSVSATDAQLALRIAVGLAVPSFCNC